MATAIVDIRRTAHVRIMMGEISMLRTWLSSLRTLLSDNHMHDTFTEELSDLCGEIDTLIQLPRAALTAEGLIQAKEQLIHLLHTLLHDPFAVPVDRDALLGSDGHLYSDLIYYEFIHERWPGSPLNPEDREPFTVRPHHLARALVVWLEEQDHPLVIPPELNERLKARAAARPRRLTVQERVAAARARVAEEAAQQRAAQAEEPLPAIAAVVEEMTDVLAAERARVEELAARRREEHQVLMNEERERQRIREALGHAEDARLRALQERNDTLTAELVNLNNRLTAEERTQREIEQACIRTERKIEERKSREKFGLESLVSVAATIAVSYAVTQATGKPTMIIIVP